MISVAMLLFELLVGHLEMAFQCHHHCVFKGKIVQGDNGTSYSSYFKDRTAILTAAIRQHRRYNIWYYVEVT